MSGPDSQSFGRGWGIIFGSHFRCFLHLDVFGQMAVHPARCFEIVFHFPVAELSKVGVVPIPVFFKEKLAEGQKHGWLLLPLH